jgi:hypothetical protein
MTTEFDITVAMTLGVTLGGLVYRKITVPQENCTTKMNSN